MKTRLIIRREIFSTRKIRRCVGNENSIRKLKKNLESSITKLQKFKVTMFIKTNFLASVLGMSRDFKPMLIYTSSTHRQTLKKKSTKDRIILNNFMQFTKTCNDLASLQNSHKMVLYYTTMTLFFVTKIRKRRERVDSDLTRIF